MNLNTQPSASVVVPQPVQSAVGIDPVAPAAVVLLLAVIGLYAFGRWLTRILSWALWGALLGMAILVLLFAMDA